MNNHNTPLQIPEEFSIKAVVCAWYLSRLITILWFGCASIALAEITGDEILGVWLVEKGDGYVEIRRENARYYGTVIGAPEGTREANVLDVNNEDPKLRNRPLDGLVLMANYKFNGERWVEGWVYDPDTGQRYKSQLTLKDEQTARYPRLYWHTDYW